MSSTTIAINSVEEFKVLYNSVGVELCVVPDANPVCNASPPGSVPEPSSIVLFGTAAILAAWQIRKRALPKQAE
jgi:hypothetical protein